MRFAGRIGFGTCGAAALALGVILSGCGTTVTGHRSVVSTATSQPAATDTPAPIPTANPATLAQPGCPPSGAPTEPHYVSVGGLEVSVPRFPPTSNYPDALIPNNAPNAPYQVPLTKDGAEQAGMFVPSPEVNPGVATGYQIEVCNKTAEAHTLTSLSLTIARFTPSSGPIPVWHICQDGPYDSATKETTNGCGGGLGGPGSDFLVATFASDSAGASATAAGNARSGGTSLPIPVGAGQSVVLYVGAAGLTNQGTYALSIGVSVDGATPTTLTPSDGAFMVAPSPVVWTGTACMKSPTMLARIPASSQDTYWVCPPTS